MPKHYAFAHPGKIGDALYTLPTIRTICERDGAVADFYTSEICRPLESLMRYQKCINDFIIPPEYKIDNDGQGVQPWQMPIRSGYDMVFQLGFQQFPQGPLHLYIARTAGLTSVPNPIYDYPEKTFFEEPYIAVAFSWLRGASLTPAYEEFINRCPIKVIQIAKDVVNAKSENMSHLDFLDVLSILSNAKMFVGFYSASLVLANGFANLPKLITLAYQGGGEQHGLHLPKTTQILIQYPKPQNALEAKEAADQMLEIVKREVLC